MVEEPGSFERRLASVSLRLRATRALEEAARLGRTGALLGVGVAVARVLDASSALSGLSPRDAVLVSLGPAMLGGALGLVFGATRPIRQERAAALAEERAAFGAVFTTALELPADHAWRAAVLAEADERARVLEPAAVVPWELPRRSRSFALLVATALAVLFAPLDRLRASAPEAAPAPVEKPALDAIAQAGAKVREASQALPPGEARRSLDAAGKELRTFLSELEAGKLGKRDALARLGEAEERLRVERAREDARRSVRRALGDDRDLEALSKLGGGSGTPEKAKLDALAKKLAADPKAREAAREALDRAARQANELPEVREALERAARETAGTSPEKTAQALDELARTLAAQPAAHEDALARKDLEEARAAVENARAAVTGEKPQQAEAPKVEAKVEPEKLAEKIPPELLEKALAHGEEKNGEKQPSMSPEDAKKLLDKLPKETLEKLAKAAQEGAEKQLPEDVKQQVQEAAKKDEESGIPPEALAQMAQMIPPELIAKAMEMQAQSHGSEGETKTPPPISPEDAQKVLEKLPPKTLEKLAKAAMEMQKNAPAGGERPHVSPEQAQELAKKLSPETLQQIQRAAAEARGTGTASGSAPGAGTASGSAPGTGTASGSAPGTGTPGAGTGNDSGSAGVLGRQDSNKTGGNPEPPPRVSQKDEPPPDEDPLVKNRARVGWSSESLAPREREELRAALERKRVPASYERAVREYFGLGKP